MGLLDNLLNQIRNFFRPGMVAYSEKEDETTNKADKKKNVNEAKTGKADKTQVKNA
jgi:hypothetical protein